MKIIKEVEKLAGLFNIIFGLTLLMLIGAFGYQFLEGWSFIDSLYFSVMTLSTVGYGDLVPTTIPSKIFTIFFVILGVSAALYALREIGYYYVERHVPALEKKIHNIYLEGRHLGHDKWGKLRTKMKK